MSDPDVSKRDEIRSYAKGYCVALVLTGLAFATVMWPRFPSTAAFGIVLGLGVLQMVVHFRFFLHISLRKSSRDVLRLILFAGLIVILMVSGTLVVLLNLRARMM